MTGGGPQSAKIVTFCLENWYFYIKIKMKLAYQFINPFKNTLKKNIGLFFMCIWMSSSTLKDKGNGGGKLYSRRQ